MRGQLFVPLRRARRDIGFGKLLGFCLLPIAGMQIGSGSFISCRIPTDLADPLTGPKTSLIKVVAETRNRRGFPGSPRAWPRNLSRLIFGWLIRTLSVPSSYGDAR